MIATFQAKSPMRAALSLVLLLAGLSIALGSALAGPLGLGVMEDFLFFRLAGIPRMDALSSGLTLCLFACLGLHSNRLRMIIAAAENCLAGPWRLPALLLLIMAASLTWFFYGFGSGAMIARDSLGYLTFTVSRSAGYPLFLELVRGATGSLDFLAPVQMILLYAAFALAGWGVARFCGSRLLGLVVAGLLMLERSQSIFGTTIMTEPLFITLITLHMVFILRAMESRVNADILLAFLSLAASCIVRPAGYSLLLGIPLLALLMRDRWKLILLGGTGILAAVMLMASAAQYVRNGQFSTQSFGGISLVGQVAPLIAADVPCDDPQLMGELAAALRPFQDSFQGLAYPRDYWRVTSGNYNAMLWPVMMPIISRHIAERHPGLSETEQAIAENQAAMALSLSVIKHRPLGFLRHVTAQYYGMWVGIYDVPEPMGVVAPRNYDALVSALASSPDYRAAGVHDDPLPQGRGRQWAAQSFDAMTGLAGLARISIFALAFCAPLLCLGRSSSAKMRLAMIYLLIQLNGYFLFISLLQASIPRYPVAFDPVTIILAALSLAVMAKYRPQADGA